MPVPDDIHVGVTLRVVSSRGLGAPVGSLATVKAVETSRSGDWLCLVEYQDRQQPKQRTRLYRSHLWANDLGRFEIVSQAALPRPEASRGMRRAQIQLRLPFDEVEDV